MRDGELCEFWTQVGAGCLSHWPQPLLPIPASTTWSRQVWVDTHVFFGVGAGEAGGVMITRSGVGSGLSSGMVRWPRPETEQGCPGKCSDTYAGGQVLCEVPARAPRGEHPVCGCHDLKLPHLCHLERHRNCFTVGVGEGS